jgi:DNA (cytosine-5)-methyltransferase 1
MSKGGLAILDLFCGAGGASVGYRRGGATETVGVDHKRQPDYPGPFCRMDAIAALDTLLRGEPIYAGGRPWWLRDFIGVHTSPPCQAYSITRHSHGNEHPDLVGPVRERLIQTGLPWVIENVEGAPLDDPVLLCGEMFDLSYEDDDGTPLVLRRHRLFETSFFVVPPKHVHSGIRVAGVYGGGVSRRSPDDPAKRGGYTPRLAIRQGLMQLPGMKQRPLSQAIPPAYTDFIMGWLLAHRRTMMNAAGL